MSIVLDSHLIWKINDMLNGEPRKNYDKVIATLNEYFKVQCGLNCRVKNIFYDNLQYKPTILRRSTHKICKLCNDCVSNYEFSYCINCCRKGDIAYLYYHMMCPNVLNNL